MSSQIQLSQEADGLLLATIDMPGRSMNVFSADLMDAIEALMDRVDDDGAVRAVVLTSGKKAFLAGADLSMVKGFTDAAQVLPDAELFELCGRLGRLFVRLEASRKPWVAAVNGLALGGGLELAMACRARVVVDDDRAQQGLPEVRWGLLPGAGGTQRLPRLVGFEKGLSMLLTGRSVTPREAVAIGLFEQAVPPDQLLDTARAVARRLVDQPFDAAEKYPRGSQMDVPFHDAEVAQRLGRHHGVSDADWRDYPAYSTIVDCVLLGARHPLAQASAIEMRQFLRLMRDPVAANMMRSLFLNRQRADKALAAPADLKIDAVVYGPMSPSRTLWQQALVGSRLPVSEDLSLAPDSLVLSDSRGAQHHVRLDVLTDASRAAELPGARAVLSPAGPYGRVLEIVSAPPATADALAALAGRMGALPYRSGDGASVMQRLATAGAVSLDAQALVALQLMDAGAAPDVATLDVAACAAGVSPAWSGGPATHLWRQRQSMLLTLDDRLRANWPQWETRLQEALA